MSNTAKPKDGSSWRATFVFCYFHKMKVALVHQHWVTTQGALPREGNSNCVFCQALLCRILKSPQMTYGVMQPARMAIMQRQRRQANNTGHPSKYLHSPFSDQLPGKTSHQYSFCPSVINKSLVSVTALMYLAVCAGPQTPPSPAYSSLQLLCIIACRVSGWRGEEKWWVRSGSFSSLTARVTITESLSLPVRRYKSESKFFKNVAAHANSMPTSIWRHHVGMIFVKYCRLNVDQLYKSLHRENDWLRMTG